MPKPGFKPQKILWVDLEMSGLSPSEDIILEIAAIATDWDFQEVAVYEGVVKHDATKLAALLQKNAAFWDANPDARDGLLAQNAGGKSLTEIEDELLSFVNENFAGEDKILLAGNSIHMDRQFIDAYWPRLAERLHYRMLDVSAWKVVFEGKFKKPFMKPENHRALDDIRGSIMELKYYLTKIAPGVGKQK